MTGTLQMPVSLTLTRREQLHSSPRFRRNGPLSTTAGEFSVFLFSEGGWFPIVDSVSWEDAQRTVGQMSTVMDCSTQIRNADETIIIQDGEILSTCLD